MEVFAPLIDFIGYPVNLDFIVLNCALQVQQCLYDFAFQGGGFSLASLFGELIDDIFELGAVRRGHQLDELPQGYGDIIEPAHGELRGGGKGELVYQEM